MASRLTDGFRDIIELRWAEFVAMAADEGGTNFEAVLVAIVYACRKGTLRAIQTALDRLDGKIATEIDVEYPKFYYLYPNAETTADDPKIIELGADGVVKNENGKMTIPAGDATKTIEIDGAPADMDELFVMEEELPTGSLRMVLEKMLNSPKKTVIDILAVSERVDAGDLSAGNPKVKSVIVAGLMKLVLEGKIGAVFEVFDQIDGKVAEKVKILGNDVYLKRFERIAPAGAVKNEDGIYMVVADNTTDTWALKLEGSKK